MRVSDMIECETYNMYCTIKVNQIHLQYLLFFILYHLKYMYLGLFDTPVVYCLSLISFIYLPLGACNYLFSV
jgi:predicted Co/Zn/Cd cation transporter (cation efflux family)